MALYKGSNKICDLYYHGVAVAEIYKGNILVWTKDAAEYLVTVSQAANGTITAAPMQGPAGTLVTLSNTPNAGYQLTYYTVNGDQIQGNTFTLSSDSTISGLFTAVTYTVTIGAHANGSLSANPMSGVYGTTVTLTGTPNTHYELDYYSVNGSQIQGNTFTLTQDSTVAATFKQKTYTVTIGTHTNGTLSASPASGVYGTTITLSGTPNSGYTLDYYTVGGSRITGNTFTLTGNTTVTAVYKSAGYPVIYQSYLDGHSTNQFNYTKTTNNIMLQTSSLNSNWSTYSGGLVTISSSNRGNLPSGYDGKKYASKTAGGYSSVTAAIPTSVTNWTVGFWFKPNTTNTLAPADLVNNSGQACTIGGFASSTASYGGNKFFLVYTGARAGHPSYNTNIQSWTIYNGGSWGTQNKYVIWTGQIDVTKWHYAAIYYNNADYSIEWYIDGTLYLRMVDTRSSKADYWSTTTKLTYDGYPRSGWFYYVTNIAGRHYVCELTVYNGKYVTPPTAPIVPA